MESARPATADDAARLAELWDRAVAETGVQRGGQRLVGSITRPAGLLPAASDQLVLAGSVDGYVVGFACARLDRKPAVPVAVVEVIYVEPEARGVGVGEALLARVLRWAEAAGAGGIDGYALPGSRSTKAFFEDQGFTTRLLTMHRRIDRGDERG
jgi:GNAT superfamily N-acetyltransferase